MMIWCSAGVIILRCWICEERKCGCKWWCGLRWWEWFVFEWFLDCCCGWREPWSEWCDLGELLIFVGDKNVEANVEFVKWDEVEYIGVGWDVMWLIILCNSPSDEWCVNDGEGGLSWELISGIVEIFIEEFSFSFWWADVEFVIWVLRSVMFDVSSVGVYSYAFCSGWNQSKAGPEYKPTSYRKYGYGQRVILYLSFIYVCANIESNKISCTDY